MDTDTLMDPTIGLVTNGQRVQDPLARVFKTLDDLIDAIDDWTDHWNENGAPFTWTKTADEILAKVRSARGSLERQIKVATYH